MMARQGFSPESVEQGMVFLRSGELRFPATSAADALCLHAEARADILKGSSVRNYKHRYNAALQVLVDGGELAVVGREAAQQRITSALEKLRGKPEQPRTASKKVKDAEAWMVKSVFGHLQVKAIKYRRVNLALVALYCLVKPKLGTRPVELHTAGIEGDTLLVRNAKRDDDSYRRLDMCDWDPSHRMAVAVLIELAQDDIASGGYDAWLSKLAENLARACKSASRRGDKIPRLAPTSFRYTAISTWHAAGFTAAEIAEMAGHLVTTTAKRHYIMARAAWAMRQEDMVRPAVVQPAAVSDDELLFDDFPRPAPKPAADKAPVDWRAHIERSIQAQVPAAVSGHRDSPADKLTKSSDRSLPRPK